MRNTPVSGDATAPGNYAALLNLVRQNMTVTANYAAVQQKLDIDDFIDYMLANYYSGNTDWAHKNWYASFNRVDPNGKWRFHSWDAEHVFKTAYGLFHARSQRFRRPDGDPSSADREPGVQVAIFRPSAGTLFQRRRAHAAGCGAVFTPHECRW